MFTGGQPDVHDSPAVHGARDVHRGRRPYAARVPVLLTRPSTAVARATASLLLDDGAQVRLFGPEPPNELRARGAFAAVGDADDHGLLEAALAQVHTLVHVGPGLVVEDPDDLVEEARLVFAAAERAGVQRAIALSLPGADPASDEPLRAAAGRMERGLAARPFPSVVVRPSLVDTTVTRDLLAALPGDAMDEVVVAPVRVEDLAAGLLAIDEARSRSSAGHVVFRAEGPERLPLAGYLRQVGIRGQDGAVDMVGRTYRPGSAAAPARRALAGPWTEPDDRSTADLWSFAGHQPQPVAP